METGPMAKGRANQKQQSRQSNGNQTRRQRRVSACDRVGADRRDTQRFVCPTTRFAT